MNNQHLEIEDQLNFGHGTENQQAIETNFSKPPKRKNDQTRKKITFKEAEKQIKQKNIEKIQNPNPQPQQERSKKPGWDERILNQPGVFDAKISKNEIFRNETKLKKQQEEQDKETKIRWLQNPPKSAIKSYENIKEIENVIQKQNYKRSTSQMKKQQRELEQLQWMVEQEKKLKKEQEQQFEEKLRQLKTQKEPQLSKEIANAKRKSEDKKKIPQQVQDQNYDDLNIQDEPDYRGEVWKDALDVMHHAAKKPLLPGQYGEDEELDRVPQKDTQYQQQYQDKTKPINDRQLQQELIEIQKRELKRQHELDALIDKHQQLLRSEAQNPNKHYKELNNKLDKLKNKMDPLLQKYQGRDGKIDFPFTGHLLARSVSKLVQLHSETLTEMLIDEMLIEMVKVLDEIEQKQNEQSRKVEQQMAIADYIDAVQDLALDQDKVEQNFQKSKQEFMRRDPRLDQYTPVIQLGTDQQYFVNPQDRVRSIEVSSGFVMKIMEQRRQRISIVQQNNIYAPKNLEQCDRIADELLEEILMERAMNMWQSSDDLAEQIFINEFQ